MAFSTAIASPNANEEKSDDNSFSALIDWGKDTWNTVKDAATGIVEDIGDAINSATSKIPVGTWEFKNGSYSTVMVCEKNGSMSITQTNFSGQTVFTGTFTASSSKITFKVQKKTSKVLFVTTNKNLDETWTIDYSLPASKEIKITSQNIPADANGYNFSKPTIFTKQNEK